MNRSHHRWSRGAVLALATATFALTTAPAAVSAGFAPARAYDLWFNGNGGPAADRTVAVDLDGDGHVDLASAKFETNKAGVRWGDGTGKLVVGIHSLLPYGGNSGGIAAGDLDGDGRLDLAVTEKLDSRVYVMRNNGDRTFTMPSGGWLSSGPGVPEDIVVADVDGDGHLDVVTSNGWGESISVLLGDGSGRLTAAAWSPIALDAATLGMAAADLDGDGHLDLALAGQAPSSIVVMRGDGTGRFAAVAGSPFASSGKPRKVAIGDLDGDGAPDVAAANQGNNVPVLMGDGEGGFTPALGSPFSVGTDLGSIQTHAVAIADLDGDGRAELLSGSTPTISTQPSSRLRVWRTPKVGAPLEAVEDGAVLMPFKGLDSLTPTDLNGDGRLDIVVGEWNGRLATLVALPMLAVERSGDGDGTVTGVPDREACEEACTGYAQPGTELVLTAAPDDRSDFVGWSGCDATDGRTCTVTFGRDRAVTARFSLERRPPSVRLTRPEPDETVAAGSAVPIDFTCRDDDEGSGIQRCDGVVADPTGTESAIADGDPLPTDRLGDHRIEVVATDRADNQTRQVRHYRVVDRTAPAVTLDRPRDGESIAHGTRVPVGYACADEPGGSGLDRCTGDLPDGAELDTSRPGVATFTVTALDRAGNRTQERVTYHVLPAPLAPPAPFAPPPAVPDAGATPTPATCAGRGVVLTGVRRRAGRVTVVGVADRALAGRRVVAYGSGRRIGRATVGADGAIAVRTRLRRVDPALRYRLVVGGRLSAAVRPHGLLVVRRSVRDGDGQLRITGRVPGERRRTLAVQVRPLCGWFSRTLRTLRTDHRGGVRATLAAPPAGSPPRVYRLRERRARGDRGRPGRVVSFAIVVP